MSTRFQSQGRSSLPPLSSLASRRSFLLALVFSQLSLDPSTRASVHLHRPWTCAVRDLRLELRIADSTETMHIASRHPEHSILPTSTTPQHKVLLNAKFFWMAATFALPFVTSHAPKRKPTAVETPLHNGVPKSPHNKVIAARSKAAVPATAATPTGASRGATIRLGLRVRRSGSARRLRAPTGRRWRAGVEHPRRFRCASACRRSL